MGENTPLLEPFFVVLRFPGEIARGGQQDRARHAGQMEGGARQGGERKRQGQRRLRYHARDREVLQGRTTGRRGGSTSRADRRGSSPVVL